MIDTHKHASKIPVFIYQTLRCRIAKDRDTKNVLSDVHSILKLKTCANGITCFVCLFVCLCVSACFPFKLLTHLIDGREKLYENHAIGVHPNITLLNTLRTGDADLRF